MRASVIYLAGLLSLLPSGRAEGLVSLNTGTNGPLVTEFRTLPVSSNLYLPRLEFNFGFATDETFEPETFLDSFTVTIQDTNQSNTAIYLTIDAGGLVLAPPTPGTIFLELSNISTAPISYPALLPVLPGHSLAVFLERRKCILRPF
jgi:hypothetical protein